MVVINIWFLPGFLHNTALLYQGLSADYLCIRLSEGSRYVFHLFNLSGAHCQSAIITPDPRVILIKSCTTSTRHKSLRSCVHQPCWLHFSILHSRHVYAVNIVRGVGNGDTIRTQTDLWKRREKTRQLKLLSGLCVSATCPLPVSSSKNTRATAMCDVLFPTCLAKVAPETSHL